MELNMDEVRTINVFFESAFFENEVQNTFTGTVREIVDLIAKDLIYNNRVKRVEYATIA